MNGWFMVGLNVISLIINGSGVVFWILPACLFIESRKNNTHTHILR